VNQTGTKWELYDMIADPDQTRDLARQQPELVTQLRTAFEAWSADVSRGAEGFKPPIPIGHTAENPVELPAPHAVFSGGVKFNGKHPNNAWLVGWDSPAANAEWSLHAVQAGQYRVSVDYLCPAANAGSTLKMVVGTTTLEAAIRATPVVQVPSPDRVPREEVYEMEWTTLPVGTVTLPEGPVKLQISPRRVANGSAWELKLVRLERLGDR
jgi:arylsulfatase A